MDTITNLQIKISFRTGEVAQWVKSIATKPYDLNLIPGTHLVEGDLSPKVSSDHHIPSPNKHVIKQTNNQKLKQRSQTLLLSQCNLALGGQIESGCTLRYLIESSISLSLRWTVPYLNGYKEPCFKLAVSSWCKAIGEMCFCPYSSALQFPTDLLYNEAIFVVLLTTLHLL